MQQRAKYILAGILLLMVFSLKGQDVQENKSSEDKDLFIDFEIMPSYPGGVDSLFSYMKRNLKYPVIAAENGVEGKVIITFIVKKDGSVSDAKVARGLYPVCDKEALRLVQSMPKWIPGTQNGKPVDVQFTLPVTFKINK